jgi:hypothetical protein
MKKAVLFPGISGKISKKLDKEIQRWELAGFPCKVLDSGILAQKINHAGKS